jgi:hypothetical protein
MKDDPSTPCSPLTLDSDTDNKIANSFSKQEPVTKKTKIQSIMHHMDNISQQVLEDMKQMVYDVMHSHQSYIYQQDLHTMDRMVNNLKRSCDLSHRNSIPAFVNFLLGYQSFTMMMMTI